MKPGFILYQYRPQIIFIFFLFHYIVQLFCYAIINIIFVAETVGYMIYPNSHNK